MKNPSSLIMVLSMAAGAPSAVSADDAQRIAVHIGILGSALEDGSFAHESISVSVGVGLWATGNTFVDTDYKSLVTVAVAGSSEVFSASNLSPVAGNNLYETSICEMADCF